MHTARRIAFVIALFAVLWLTAAADWPRCC